MTIPTTIIHQSPPSLRDLMCPDRTDPKTNSHNSRHNHPPMIVCRHIRRFVPRIARRSSIINRSVSVSGTLRTRRISILMLQMRTNRKRARLTRPTARVDNRKVTRKRPRPRRLRAISTRLLSLQLRYQIRILTMTASPRSNCPHLILRTRNRNTLL